MSEIHSDRASRGDHAWSLQTDRVDGPQRSIWESRLPEYHVPKQDTQEAWKGRPADRPTPSRCANRHSSPRSHVSHMLRRMALPLPWLDDGRRATDRGFLGGELGEEMRFWLLSLTMPYQLRIWASLFLAPRLFAADEQCLGARDVDPEDPPALPMVPQTPRMPRPVHWNGQKGPGKRVQSHGCPVFTAALDASRSSIGGPSSRIAPATVYVTPR